VLELDLDLDCYSGLVLLSVSKVQEIVQIVMGVNY
jgi:hypothetical protein